MSHWSLPVSVCLAASLVLILPSAHAAAPLLVTLGEDPAGDAEHAIAPAANVGSLVSADRTDILAVHMGANDTHLTVNMTIGAAPTGTGGYLYRVSFVHAETRYFTCWNVQWTGGQVDRENLLGCSRFNQDEDGEQVGPDQTSNGVLTGEAEYNGTEAAFVQWTVGLTEIGGDLDVVTNITADTWFRGVSICCAGSTTSSRYLWNPSDVAPDAGDWTFDPNALGDGEAPLGVVLTAEAANLTVHAGQYAAFDLGVGLNGTVPEDNVSLALGAEGLEDWNWRIEPDVVTMNATNANSTAVLNVTVASDRPAGTTLFNVTACTEDGTCGNATLAFTVEVGAKGPPPEEVLAPNATAGPPLNATAAPDEESLPAPAPLWVIVGVLSLLAWRRGRRTR